MLKHAKTGFVRSLKGGGRSSIEAGMACRAVSCCRHQGVSSVGPENLPILPRNGDFGAENARNMVKTAVKQGENTTRMGGSIDISRHI